MWLPGLCRVCCLQVPSWTRGRHRSVMISPDITLASQPVRDQKLAVLRANRTRLTDHYGVRGLALFGSVPRCEATDSSDVA